MAKKATKKSAPMRKRYYGMVKLRRGAKVKFESHENKHGWSLGMIVKDRPTIWFRNVRFATNTDVENAVGGAPVRFVSKKTA